MLESKIGPERGSVFLRIFDVGFFISAVGASLTLGSSLIPWYVGNTTYSLFEPSKYSWFAPFLILMGGALSLLSRYGALITSAGLCAYVTGPPVQTYFGPMIPAFSQSNFMPIPESYLGLGFWMAWIGILISLQGGSLNFLGSGYKPSKVLEWILTSVGTLIAAIGLIQYNITRSDAVGFLAGVPALGVITMGAVMACSSLIRTGVWAMMLEPRSYHRR